MEQKTTRQSPEIALLAALAVFVMLGGIFFGVRLQERHRSDRAREQALAWRETPRAVAKAMIAKYGSPDRIAEQELVWYSRRPWNRIAVANDSSRTPLEQTVGYQLTSEAAKAVEGLGHGVSAIFETGELAARADNEGENILALNMVDEIARGVREARQARDFYGKTVELASSGKTSPYMQELMFTPYRPEKDPWVREFRY